MSTAATAKTIATNTIFLFGAEAASRVLSFFLIVAIARALGAGSLGKYSFALAVGGFFLTFADFGLSTLLLKEVSKDKGQTSKYLNNVFAIKLAIAAITAIAALLTALLYGLTETILLVFIFLAAMFFNFITDPIRMLFLAYEKSLYYAAVIVAERLIAVSAGLFVLLKGYGIFALLGIFVLSYASSFLLALIIARKRFVMVKPEINLPYWRQLIVSAWPFWIAFVFMAMYYRVDTVMLTIMKGYEPVGWYNAAYKIVESLSFLPIVISTAIFPAMSRFHSQSKEQLRLLYSEAIHYVLILALPIVVGTILVADRIILFFYNGTFANSAIALKILIIAEGLIFVTYVMGTLLNAIDKQRTFTLITMAYALLNVVFNLLFIPRYSYAGAAAVSAATQLFGLLALLYFTKKYGYSINLIRHTVKPAIAATLMGLSVIFMGQYHLFLIAPLAAFVYFAVLIAIKGIGKEGIELAKKTVLRRE